MFQDFESFGEIAAYLLAIVAAGLFLGILVGGAILL